MAPTKAVKRILSILVLIAILLCAVVMFVDTGWIMDELQTDPEMTVEEKIYNGLMEQQERIYVRRYALTKEPLNQIWNDVVCSNPETFFVGDTYEFTMLGDYVLYVTPRYDLTGTELIKANADYKLAIRSVLENVDESWSDLKTALYLHDWLILNCSYDDTLTYYDAYSMLTLNTGVCQAYTLAYQALLEECGIPCRYVLSSDMEHSWNIVQIDGEWYNVDLTYDDPTFDRLGKADHTYFLVSDAVINTDHYGGASAVSCDSTIYDDAFWADISTAFVSIDGTFYCISGDTICRWDDDGLTRLYTISDLWFATDDPYSYWEGCHASLDVWGDTLIFNTPKEVKLYHPETDSLKTVYTYDGSESIYGVVYNGDSTITCRIADNPNVPGTLQTVHLS